MDCQRFEQDLDDLSSGRLSASQRHAARAHAAECAGCGELLALAMLPAAAELEAAGFTESVLARTSGSPCESAALRLAQLQSDPLDGSLEPSKRELLDDHLASCDGCRDLATVLSALSRALPSLAQERPDAGFVDDVLRRTLPVHVQLRRWWGRVWPQWLRRPRFASEAAFIGLLVLLLVFATPGSPLEAVPRRALAVARQPAAGELVIGKLGVGELRVGDLGVGEYLSTRFEAVRATAEASSEETLGNLKAASSRTAAKADEVVAGAAESLATFWRDAASLLRNDGENAGQESTESNEENP